jgi:uncharacterized MAPEG superfamily protein
MDIAVWCVFITFVLIYLPRPLAAFAAMQQEGRVDLAYPRQQQARITGLGARAQAAHLNTMEAFAPFAAAVWIAYHGGAETGLRDALAVSFVFTRVLFIGAYLANLNPWRTVVWTLGFLCVIGLFLSPLIG